MVCTPRPTLDNTIPTLVIQGDVCAATMWDDVQGWAQYEDGGVADNLDGSEWLTFKVPDGSERLVVLFGKSNSDIPVNMREVNTYYTDYESHNPQYTRNDKPLTKKIKKQRNPFALIFVRRIRNSRGIFSTLRGIPDS